jgi:hypothetical protein
MNSTIRVKSGSTLTYIDLHGQCEAVNSRNINAALNIRDEGLQFLRLDVRL